MDYHGYIQWTQYNTDVLVRGGRRIRDKGNVTTEAEGQNQRLEDAILLAFFFK